MGSLMSSMQGGLTPQVGQAFASNPALQGITSNMVAGGQGAFAPSGGMNFLQQLPQLMQTTETMAGKGGKQGYQDINMGVQLLSTLASLAAL